MSAVNHSLPLVLCGILLPLVLPLSADTLVSVDTTQNGGSFVVADDSVLLVTHGSNDPTLTLANGATANFSGATVIGSLIGESGQLLIIGGASMANTGTSGVLGTYGSVPVVRGTGSLGLNSGSSGVATVTGAGSRWDNGSDLHVGRSGEGSLLVSDGGVVTNRWGYVGMNAGSSGEVTVTGAGSRWENTLHVYVGLDGDGVLMVSDGGVVTNVLGYLGTRSGSTGVATVTGAGSTWANSANLAVGGSGNGTLMVSDGGLVTVGGFSQISSSSGSMATVTGAGSAWTTVQELYVGNNGTGTLVISDGGSVTNRTGYIAHGSSPTGKVTVTGAGSTWGNSSQLYVGYLGNGTLEVLAGGLVTSTDGYLSFSPGASGSTALVAGSGSTWQNSGVLEVGRLGTGTLTVADGGLVSVGGNALIGVQNGATGSVSVTGAGSRLEVTGGDMIIGGNALATATTATGSASIGDGGEVTVSGITRIHGGGDPSSVVLAAGGTLITYGLDATGGGEFHFNAGELRLMGGSMLLNSTVDVPHGGILGGVGNIIGDLMNAGIVAPGLSPGLLFVEGDYIQASGGVIEIEIAGLASGGGHDVLAGTGSATLSGIIRVILDGYNPVEGDSFQILGFSSFVDDGFAFDFSSAMLGPGLYWNTDQFLSDGTLLVTVPEPGRGMVLLMAVLALLGRRNRRPDGR